MQASLLDIDFEAEMARLHRARSRGRSKGRHCSQIIHYLLEKMDPETYGQDSGIDPMIAHRGFLWEDTLSLVLGRQWYGSESTSQMEVEVDNIFMTIDWFSTKRNRVLEAKATKISAENPITSKRFWHWRVQMMAYCRAMKTFEAELVAFFMNGSYELGGGRFGLETAKAYLLRWTEIELEENWRMLRKADKRMTEEGIAV